MLSLLLMASGAASGVTSIGHEDAGKPPDSGGQELGIEKLQRTYESLFQWAAAYTRGEWEFGEPRRMGCESQCVQAELALIRDFLNIAPRQALNASLGQVHLCIREGRYHDEVIDNACEGALFSLGFFETATEDASILASFEPYRHRKLLRVQADALRNVFYPRYNGLVWTTGRPLTRQWVVLLKQLNRRNVLYTHSQLMSALHYFQAPPRELSRETFL